MGASGQMRRRELTQINVRRMTMRHQVSWTRRLENKQHSVRHNSFRTKLEEALMKPILIACSMIMLSVSAEAQMPSVPSLPSSGNLPTAAPSVPSMPSSGNLPTAAPNMPSSGNPSSAAPSMPGLPSGGTPSMAAPTITPPSGASMQGAGQTSNPIDQAKTEAECKIPTNATKPECVQLMLNK